MRIRSAISAVFVAFTGADYSLYRGADQTMADPPSSTPSASWTVSQWIQWRELQIRYILQPTFQVEGEALLSRDEVITRAARAYALVEAFDDIRSAVFLERIPSGTSDGEFYQFHQSTTLDGVARRC